MHKRILVVEDDQGIRDAGDERPKVPRLAAGGSEDCRDSRRRHQRRQQRQQKAQALGAVEGLVKPIELNSLLEVAGKYCGAA